ncbi:MAG: polyamine aminopropyltransferase [Gammaproteobacteria bacterium]|nr:MAG: polyamine aminopropyltransferase [Gammaproteobacteria bacterium]
MQNNNWFTEECAAAGTAFSLEINEKLHEEKTPYQKIEIYSTKNFGKLMVIDGFIMLSERDNFIYHEMMSHPALFSHLMPRNIVIVGGGDCGTLLEVVKHDCVEKITQVEIDRRVTDLSLEYFPQLCAANYDPRVKLIFDDAIEWMRNAPENSIDLIIVDSTDPIGPAKGLFSTPFYKDCFRALKTDGLLVQQSESPLIHLDSIINPMHKYMGEAGFTNVQLLNFPQPVYPTGWWSATLANKQSSIHYCREQESKSLQFETQYYNHAIHIASFASPQFLLKQF